MPFTSKLKGVLRSKESKSPSPLPKPSPLAHEASCGYSSQAAGPQDLLTHATAGPASTATNVQASAAPISKGEAYGVKVLYGGGTEANVDIVFVHGLTGNAYKTWLHQQTGVHWPSELLRQDIPDARVISFGYDADIVNFWNPASSSRLSNHAENMVIQLVQKRERTNTETTKILFVGHSLGGLVIEHALIHSRNAAEKHLHQIERCTAGIVFLGVPHCGADLASWASLGTRMVSVLRRANEDIVAVLKPGSEVLRAIQNGFHNILRRRKDEGSEISITCFFEELRVTGIGEIVPLHSAEIKGYGCYAIHANHMNMTKFPNREDPGYDAILGELQRWRKTVCRALENEPQSAVDKVVDRRKKPPEVTARPDAKDHRSAKIWMVPRAANPLYTGRTELGEHLAQLFSFDPSTLPMQQRTFVISGVGGIGKSEVCLKYVEDHGDEYWGVFWLDARSIATAEQGYIDLGRRCSIAEPSVGNVKSWLACNSQRWLLIIDNADDRSIDYSTYIPPGRRGDILLTTRNPECAIYKTVGSETLGDLEPELACKLLLQATSIAENQWKKKEDAAAAVVNILGSHTLAIIQAGAFIRQKLCTLEQYPTYFQQQKEQLLKFHSKQHVSTYRNVYTTFEVSAEYLQNSKEWDALNLLHIIAFMHNSGISETMFQRASDYASELRNKGTENDEKVLSLSVRHVARLPEFAQQRWSTLQDRWRWRKACAILESLSIITMHEDDDSITISAHSLVHAWAKERQDHQSRCRGWQSAATILALSCEGWYTFRPFFYFLQPHMRACVNHEIEDYTRNMPDMEAAQVLFLLASVFNSIREESSLSHLIQHIRVRLQDRYEAEHEIALQIKLYSGLVSMQQGKYSEAVELFEFVVEIQGKLAEDHVIRSRSQYELAGAYQGDGQVSKAIELLEKIVKIEERLPEDHSAWLRSQHGLAIVYRDDGQIDKAIELLEHITILKERLPDDHPSRLASQHELASAYGVNGQIDEAIQLLEHVVKIRKETLAKDHPSRLRSQHNLAISYRENGQIDEAIALFEYVIKIIKETLAEDYPSRLRSQYELAISYQENGQIDEAIALLEYVVNFDKETLAEDHPSRLASQYALAMSYRANGQIDEAIEMLEQVVNIDKETFAEDHPSRLDSQHELAISYRANGQIDEAIEMLEQVVNIDKETLAEDHPDRLASQYNLAISYQKNGQIDKAIKLLKQVVKFAKETLAEDHPDRLDSQRALDRAIEERAAQQEHRG